MRLSVATLICTSLDVSGAFTHHSIFAKSLNVGFGKLTVSHATETKTDQYDDWYDDFDPSKFDNYNQKSEVASSSAEHDYTRDTSMDNSNVDLNEVNYLISERLILRKSRRFDEADAMRDELMEKHGVMVQDKESMWRSGCSNSGSGRHWSTEGRKDKGRRAPKHFGPNGHDYNLSRDAGPNQSSLSEPEIHKMLAERLDAKINRDYDTADMIQEDLINAGVAVHDKNKEWRADGARFGDFSSRKYSQSAQSEFTADVDQIEAMIGERSQAKSDRVYQKADELRDALFHEFDVTVDDKRLEWSVGGQFGQTESAGRQRLERFERSPRSSETENDDKIQKMLDERDAARANRDFDVADGIREELMGMDIFIDDRKRQWSVGRLSDDEMGGYTRRGGGSLTDEESEEITQLLMKRHEHKRNRKFKSADAIRDKLQDTFNVQVDDRNREWHVVTNEYTMSLLSSSISDETQNIIKELVEQRAVAKLQQDYDTADSIRDTLMEEYSVSVDDRIKEWKKLDSLVSERENETLGSTVLDQDLDEDNALENTQMEHDDEEKEPETRVLESIEELQELTVPMLKEKLRAMELPVSGRKAELVQRILGNESA